MSKTIPNEIFQFSLLSAVAVEGGLKEGGPPAGFLASVGNHGIGMSEDGDNDMIQIDGQMYSVDEDGEATEADEDDQLPFCMVTVFQPPKQVKAPKGTTSKKVKEVFEKSKNTPLSFRLKGKFGYISTKQQTYWDVQGTIFGFSVPAWQKDISGEGLQCCFLAEDKQKGGRVLDFETAEGVALQWAKTGKLNLKFPDDEDFEQVRLRRNSVA